MKVIKIYVYSDEHGEREFTSDAKAWRFYCRQVRRQGGDREDIQCKRYGFEQTGKAEYMNAVEIRRGR